ncbi:MAG: hypothetical protein JJV98_16665 [Desulfosarcina sp.]|nr:hypothetical protein [Desulfobacterales bacterium]
MKGLWGTLIATGVLLFGIVALSTAATRKDVIGTYELTCKETFHAKGYGKDHWIDTVQLVLRADDTFTLGDTEGTFLLNPKGKKILLQIEESSLDTFKDGCTEIISDLAFEKGTILEPREITCVIQTLKISKIKIDKKTGKAKGKLKVAIKGIASVEVDGELKQNKFSYKNICKINNEGATVPPPIYSDDFSTDTTAEYTVVDTKTSGGFGSFLYDGSGQRVRVDTDDDVGIQFSHTLPPLDNGVFQIDFRPLVKYPNGGNIELVLRAADGNYYKVHNTDGYGAKGISKYVGGVKVDSADFSSEFSQGVDYTITIRFSPTATTVEAFGQVLVMNTDTTAVTVSSFEILLDQQDAYFDNMLFSDQPFVLITNPQSNHLQSGLDLLVQAVAVNLQLDWKVKFILEDNATNAIQEFIDVAEPFEHTFSTPSNGEYTLEAIIIDGALEPVPGDFTSDTRFSIGIGDYYVAFGDSITFGVGDDLTADGFGYPPILEDLLGFPNAVVNAGIGGEESIDGLARIQSVIDSYPEASHFLILFGTNDSHGTMPVPSGLKFYGLDPGDPGYGELLNPGDPGYGGSFLDSMQQIIDAVIASGKTPILTKVPITLGSCSTCAPFSDPDTASRNILIQDYNTVIDALVAANGIGTTPPDYYDYFRANQDRFSDNLHPDGIGYQSMANLWLDALTP